MADMSEREMREIVDRIEVVFNELTTLKMLPPEAVAAEMMARGYGWIFKKDIVTARNECADVIANGRNIVTRHVNRAERRAGKRLIRQ